MILPGHVSAAYLAARRLPAERSGIYAACMFPDFVDKPLRWFGRRTPNDRIPAHTALAGALTTAAAWRWRGPAFARGWVVGFGLHLMCDQINAHLNPGRLYLWWPFKRYALHEGPTGLKSSLADFRPASVAVEATLTLVATVAWLIADKGRMAGQGRSWGSGCEERAICEQ